MRASLTTSQIPLRTSFHLFVAVLFDELRVHQFAADGHRARAGLQEFACCLQIHTTGRNHQNMGQWAFQRLDILRATHGVRGKNFHHVSAGFPRGQHLCRCQGTRANHLRISLRHLDGGKLQRGSHKELGAGKHAHARSLGIENGARTEHNPDTKLIRQFFQNFDGAGNRHGHFGSPNATFINSFYRSDSRFSSRGSDHRHYADFGDECKNLLDSHVFEISRL